MIPAKGGLREYTMEYINIMKDIYQYLSSPGEKEYSISELARRYTYEPQYFGWLFSSFFDISFKELKEKACSRKIEEDRIPFEKEYDESIIERQWVKREELVLSGRCMEILEGQEEETYKRTALEFLRCSKANPTEEKKEQIAVWIHDEKYRFQYFLGTTARDGDIERGQFKVILPESEYLVWQVNQKDIDNLENCCKMLVKQSCIYRWENGNRCRREGHPFLAFDDNCLRLYLPADRTGEKKKKKYHLDTWIDYINEHIREDLTIENLAVEFGYSVQHFRHIFSLYYGMTASDYIRKKKLQLMAESIRKGKDASVAAQEYGFKSYQGAAKAFEKEFHMSLTLYKKAEFQVVDLKRYYSMYKEKLHISFMELNEIKAVCHTVIPDIQEEVDLPAQINYWLHRDFPCMKNKRLNYNRQRKEDKVALWHTVEKNRGELIEVYHEYILGPVVDDMDGIEGEELFYITIQEGRYAVFETDQQSDRENLVDTIRMFARCVYFGWIQENMEKVDFTRYTFERYLNDKVFVYVPVKK